MRRPRSSFDAVACAEDVADPTPRRVSAQDPVIDEDCNVQSVADSVVEEDAEDGRIDSAAESADYSIVG